MHRPRHHSKTEIPWWLLAIALLGLFVVWAIVADEDYAEIFQALAGGIFTTLWVTAVAFSCACVLGLIVALGRTSRLRVLRELATFYIEILRGVPMLVALFYVAFVGAPWLVQAVNWVI